MDNDSSNNSKNSSNDKIKELEEKIKDKDKKIVELAETVKLSQGVPRISINKVKYRSTYTPKQIDAMKKDGKDVTNLKVEEPILQKK